MKNIILIIIFEIFLLNISNAQTREFSSLLNIPLKEHFDTNNYDAGIQNWCFDQNKNGELFIANNKGLLEFDGQNWILHQTPISTTLRVVKVSSKDTIFVGGQGQIGFFSNNGKERIFTSLLPLLPKDKPSISETWKIIEHNNSIYFNTESEIFAYNNHKIKSINLPGYMRFSFKVSNRFFAQFYDKGLYELKNDEFHPIENTTITNDIVAILPFKSNFYCLTRNGEIYTLNKQGLSQIKSPKNLGTINSAIKLTSNNYAVGTQNNGVFIFSPTFKLINHFTKNNGLSDRTVKSLYEDNFQNLWVALNNGIDYLKLNLPFSLINEELGIEGTGYAATYYNNSVYLGTNNGAYVGKNNNATNQVEQFNIIPKSEGQVYNFTQINNALFLNHDRGAFEVKNSQFLTQFETIGNWNLKETNNPNVIAGGGYRGITFYEKTNNSWKPLPNRPILDESLRMMEFENDSVLWATHNLKGVFKIEFDQNFNQQNDVQHFSKKDGLPTNNNTEVFSIDDKLIFSSKKGIYQFNKETNRFGPNNYLNNYLGEGLISAITSNSKKSIFYIQNQKFGELTNKGIGNFDSKKSIFKHINRLISDNLSNISVLNDENILIGAKEGFILYNPQKKTTINPNFKVLLKSIDIESSSDSTKTFQPNTINLIKIKEENTIKIHFASPYFDGFENIQFSYRLTPLDKQWSKWSTTNYKEFTHLPPNQYTLEIKAINIYNNESDITSYSFEVLPAWYATNWMKACYLFLLVISIILIPFIQRKRHKKEKSIIFKNKATALKIKDEKITDLANEKLKSEIDLKNDQLSSITIQLVKNNEFIQNIQHEISDSLNLNKPEKGMKRIIKSINNELSKNDSWDKFAYHFDQVHGNYLKKLADNNVKLSPREIKLAAFLRMNMSSKEIATMLNITVRGVELARYRLRKKLNLNRDQNLVEYLIQLDDS